MVIHIQPHSFILIHLHSLRIRYRFASYLLRIRFIFATYSLNIRYIFASYSLYIRFVVASSSHRIRFWFATYSLQIRFAFVSYSLQIRFRFAPDSFQIRSIFASYSLHIRFMVAGSCIFTYIHAYSFISIHGHPHLFISNHIHSYASIYIHIHSHPFMFIHDGPVSPAYSVSWFRSFTPLLYVLYLIIEIICIYMYIYTNALGQRSFTLFRSVQSQNNGISPINTIQYIYIYIYKFNFRYYVLFGIIQFNLVLYILYFTRITCLFATKNIM